jgi:hypothetical protein
MKSGKQIGGAQKYMWEKIKLVLSLALAKAKRKMMNYFCFHIWLSPSHNVSPIIIPHFCSPVSWLEKYTAFLNRHFSQRLGCYNGKTLASLWLYTWEEKYTQKKQKCIWRSVPIRAGKSAPSPHSQCWTSIKDSSAENSLL